MNLIVYLTIATLVFLIGILGLVLNRRNIIMMLLSLELILLSVNLNFAIYSVYLDDIIGQLFALFVLTIAAAESAIGLAILVVFYRIRGTVESGIIKLVKG